jgi:hypothetical protein
MYLESALLTNTANTTTNTTTTVYYILFLMLCIRRPLERLRSPDNRCAAMWPVVGIPGSRQKGSNAVP